MVTCRLKSKHTIMVTIYMPFKVQTHCYGYMPSNLSVKSRQVTGSAVNTHSWWDPILGCDLSASHSQDL